MPNAFQDNVVVVTGASSGIGREIALQLAFEGARLVIAARDESRLQAVAEVCRDRGGEVLVVQTDVTDAAQCKWLIEQTIQEYGRLDTLINNAGLSMVFRFEDLQDMTLPDRIMRVNYLGSLYCTYYALPYVKQVKGRIVGVSSLTGRAGVPLRTAYAASKHAMAGFFDSLRIELKHSGVSVTMAYPDFVQTEVRNRALGADGKPVGIHPQRHAEFMTAKACARIIIRAAAERKREVIMSLRGKVGQWIKMFAPGLVDRMAQRAMEKVQYTRE